MIDNQQDNTLSIRKRFGKNMRRLGMTIANGRGVRMENKGEERYGVELDKVPKQTSRLGYSRQMRFNMGQSTRQLLLRNYLCIYPKNQKETFDLKK